MVRPRVAYTRWPEHAQPAPDSQNTDSQHQMAARTRTANTRWPEHEQPTLDGLNTDSQHRMARTRTANTSWPEKRRDNSVRSSCTNAFTNEPVSA